MKKLKNTVITLITVLFCCLTVSCGQDDLEDKYLSITGTWGLTETAGYYFFSDQPLYLKASFDPYKPSSVEFEYTLDEGICSIYINCLKCLITESSDNSYHLILYYYDEIEKKWEKSIEGDSTDGKDFKFPEGFKGSLRILTGSKEKMNAAFIDQSSMFYRYTFTKMD